MSIQVSVVSPERILFEGEATSVTLSGKKGSFSVLNNHAPLIAELEAGLIEVTNGDKKHRYIIDGGFAEVKNNNVSALVEGALEPTEVDVEATQSELDKLVKEVSIGKALLDKEKLIQIQRARLRYSA